MNCEDFNEQMADFEDGGAGATARAHLEMCGSCRAALARREAFGRALRISMARETEGLALSREAKQRIRETLRPEPESRKGLAGFWKLILIPSAAALVVFLAVREGVRPRMQDAEAGENCFIIDVPFQTETHVQRQEQNGMVDAIVKQTETAEANFSP